MSGWESLYSTATCDYNNGNYKDSYTNYLKAASALLYKLNHEVSFANRDTVKTKPFNAVHLFTQLKSCVQRLEDILQNRTTNGTFSSSQSYHISDLATSIITVNPTPQHLPLIPFSPLTRKSMHHAHKLATANQKVSITKQKSSDNSNKDDLSTLRKLDEEIRHHRNKLDQVNSQIQAIGEVTLLHWDANEVSKQLTIIESELCKKVDFKKDLTLIKDKRTSKAQACMDFHRYLTNSFTHQFMIYADTARSSGNSPRAQHPRENIIAHAVKIARSLLSHRNFNSFAALMKALTSPEVRRIRRIWANLPARTNAHIKELSSLIKKEDNDYKAYKEILTQVMEPLRDVQGMIVIPWMQPHYEEIRAITQSYTSGKSGDNTGVILSEPGQRKLASIFSLLKQCQSNVINTDDEEWHSNNIDGTRKVSPSNSHKISTDGTTNSLPLDCMGNGNLELHHWLVSRIYLTKQQLIDESMEIEALGENEVPLRVENEYEDEEESGHNIVGRRDIGSEDGGDEAGTSVTNESRSQSNKPSPNTLEEHNNSLLSSKTPFTSKHERSESGSKSIVNGTSSTSVSREISKSEEPKINVEIIENDSVGTNSLKTSSVVNGTIESSSQTKAIPIPQPAGQKSHQPSISPASMLTNLNPHAEPFIPRLSSYSSSAPGPTSDTLNVSIRDLTEMGKTMGNTNTNATDDDDDDGKFVYPIVNENKSDDDDDDEGGFVYKPQTSIETTSNDLKDNAEDEDMVFVYSEGNNKEEKSIYPDANNSQDEQDDGEGTSFVYTGNDNNTSSDYNNNTNINKNGTSGVTKVDKPSDSMKLTDWDNKDSRAVFA
ncbi:ras guanine nucleotide exchange factor domain-containing protein [Glomus cerebriforme]|uniref:Ras guanine nucleotide exchange factor domain-containing protein n=1 Tax=Glomus cerebriforme TaxID=658196 RepID=A0A397SXJ2_9GLOM|nr:ras guanine nucleotide exchange factor domain-containing protein [Glomus cerebriforme]RIA95960.1 ras guanine nucleotide exchange factor domain-containing protein [Glomus cerebriforme]